jgi:hypothetical protein
MKLLTKDKNNKYQLNPKLSEAKRNEINVINKCTDCDSAYTYIPIGEGNIYQACKLDHKLVNAYGCDRELLGNSARRLNPDEDAMDLYKGKFLDEFQRGEH